MISRYRESSRLEHVPERRLPSVLQKTGGDPRVYLARTHATWPIVMLLSHAWVGMVQYGAGEVGSPPSVGRRGRSCSSAEQVR